MLASNILTYARPKGQMPLGYSDFLKDLAEPLELIKLKITDTQNVRLFLKLIFIG